MRKRFTVAGIILGLIYVGCLIVHVASGASSFASNMEQAAFSGLITGIVIAGAIGGFIAGTLVTRLLDRRRLREERLQAVTPPSTLP